MNHRAVNQVVGALLVIAVTVSAAVLLYVFAIGTVARTTGGGQQVAQQLILEGYDWGGGSTQLSGSFKNVGQTPITLDSADVFVNGVAGTLTVATATLGPQQSTTFTVNVSSGTFVRGVAYTLKIVTASGALASYSIVCGGTS